MKYFLYLYVFVFLGCATTADQSRASSFASRFAESGSHGGSTKKVSGKKKNSQRAVSNSESDEEQVVQAQPEQNSNFVNTPHVIQVHYEKIFERSREILKQDDEKKQVNVSKSVPESALIEYLQNHPEKMMADPTEVIKAVRKESRESKDPTKHLRLVPPVGMPGYSDLKFYVSHPYYKANQLVPASNLVKVWNDFLRQAHKKIILNVFDFDLKEVAETLISRARDGVSVVVGIDSNTIKNRPEVNEVYQSLLRGGVKAVAVDSTNLNHQKMVAIDWDVPEEAKVLFSSGNLTQSCLGPEGDLKDVPPAVRPKRSVPNANHVITMNSWLLANLVSNELTKTLDEHYHYRGSQYPVLGSYQITGPGVDPNTLNPYPDDSLIISFSPEGGFKDINKNIIGYFIRKSNGPIRMIQFAFSSKAVTEALLEKAQEQGDQFDFKSVGDTPFAMQKWSQFLVLSGIERRNNKKKEKEYFESEAQPFRDAVGKEAFEKLRDNIKVGPWYYSTGKVKVDEKVYAVSAKIHHKVLAAGPFAIVGTSFNFSNSAQQNNEQILVFKNRELASMVDGMEKWLAEQSKGSVFDEAVSRNRFVTKPEHVLLTKGQSPVKPSSEDESDDDKSIEALQAQP